MKVTRIATELYQSRKRINVLRGGAGSSKSYSAIQVEIRKGFESKERVLFVRKVAKTLRTSVFQLIKDVLVNSGFVRGEHYDFNSTDMSFQLSNGTMFIMAGLDDVDKLKSIAGITRIVIEEADQVSEDDFDQLNLRLRGLDIKCPQITLMFNPVSQSHWLKKRFFDTKSDDVYISMSSYLDNPFLDESYKKMLLELEWKNPQKHRIYVKNEWGIEDTNKLFLRNFNRTKHVKPIEYDPDLDTYLAFDLNYNMPTCLVIQSDGNECRVLRSYGEKGIVLPYLCKQVQKDYPDLYYLTINGDASGHHSQNITDNRKSYEIIKSIFDLTWDSFSVPKANPTHRRSRMQCNSLVDFGVLIIDPSCEDLINDIESAIVDVNDSLDPWKKENPERSHWIDAWRYHVNATYNSLFRDIDFNEI